ncbi:hypothetical protein A2U01_0081526, partial [Trifolium medium]|nr:hypothetical protein [Trifolium medium]
SRSSQEFSVSCSFLSLSLTGAGKLRFPVPFCRCSEELSDLLLASRRLSHPASVPENRFCFG